MEDDDTPIISKRQPKRQLNTSLRGPTQNDYEGDTDSEFFSVPEEDRDSYFPTAARTKDIFLQRQVTHQQVGPLLGSVRNFFFSKPDEEDKPAKPTLIEALANDHIFSFSQRWPVIENQRPKKRHPFGFFCSLLLSSLSVLLYIVLFTQIPEKSYFSYNRDTIRKFAEDFEEEGSIILFTSIGGAIFVFMLDLHNGSYWQRKASAALLLLSGVAILASLSFATRNLVVVPLVVFAVSVPIGTGLIKYVFFGEMDNLQYMLGLLIPLWLGVVASLFIEGITFAENPYRKPAIRALYIRQAGCSTLPDLETQIALDFNLDFNDIDTEELLTLDTPFSRQFNTRIAEAFDEDPELDGNGESCVLRALVLYNGFTILTIAGTINIWFIIELMRVNYKDRQNNELSNLSVSFQVFLLLFGLVVFSTWIVATVIPDDNEGDVSFSTLLLIYISVIAALGAFIAYNVLGTSYLAAQLNRTPIGKRVYKGRENPFAKAAIVYFVSPVFFAWAILSIPTQLIRRYTPIGKRIDGEEKKLFVIQEVVKVAKKVFSWDLGKILHSSLLIGIVYFFMSAVFGKFITVILAGVRVGLESLSLPLTILAFVTIGLLMFLLPPVPGLPVYLFGGVIIFGKAQDDLGVVPAMILAIVVNFLLKLLAVAVEQKIIGECFGSKSRSIKSIVGINEPSLKAISYILSSKGNWIAKMAILCGGPDWPTSVLTGILKLPLFPMLLGTFPVIILVTCATAAGAFLVYSDGNICLDVVVPDDIIDCEEVTQNEIISGVRGVLLGLMIIIQAVLFLLAFHCIGKVIDNKPEEIAKIPDDPDVKKYEEENQIVKALLEERKCWHNMSNLHKILHVLMTAIIIIGNWALQLGGSVAYNSIEPTDDPENPLQLGGYILFSIMVLPILYFFIFNRIISSHVNEKLRIQVNTSADAE